MELAFKGLGIEGPPLRLRPKPDEICPSAQDPRDLGGMIA